MTRTALVLAAHGSRHEPAVNAQVRAWAAEVAERTTFDEVAVAFHQGSPTFSEVLDSLSADDVTVVPVMTSAGYYSDTVLPRELARNRRYLQITVHQTVPVGLHPNIPGLVANRVIALRNSYGLRFLEAECRKIRTRCASDGRLPTTGDPIPSREITLAIVGHGTPRHLASRNSTYSLVDQLRAPREFGEVRAFFLDDDPPIEQLIELATKPGVLVVPFLIAAGPHATRDLPRRIGMPAREGGAPFLDEVGGKRVFFDVPFGAYPAMIDLIIDLATPLRISNSPASQPFKKEVA